MKIEQNLLDENYPVHWKPGKIASHLKQQWRHPGYVGCIDK